MQIVDEICLKDDDVNDTCDLHLLRLSRILLAKRGDRTIAELTAAWVA